MQITIIGAGVMGEIFTTALARAFPSWQINIADKNLEKLNGLKKHLKRIKIFTDNKLAIKNAEIIILAVKPQVFSELSGEINGLINKKTCVISIMAGIKIKTIAEKLFVKKIIRGMPNLGARVGKSMTVWTDNNLDKKTKAIGKKIFGIIGKEMWVKNDEVIDKATAVSGSGPGFFFYVVEEWLGAVRSLGFRDDQASELLLTTIDGANTLLQKEKNPKQLRQQVTSKGGTTESGLEVLQKSGLREIWQNTLQKAVHRALELGV
ncbi:MAG: pyrroline-5-carboxylate reductase [Candidatus Magasanikbacteria bacterium]|jgi:pyrroline-5-carboxylate reductase